MARAAGSLAGGTHAALDAELGAQSAELAEQPDVSGLGAQRATCETGAVQPPILSTPAAHNRSGRDRIAATRLATLQQVAELQQVAAAEKTHSELEKERFETVFEMMRCRLPQHREKLLQAVIDDRMLPECCIIGCGRQFSRTFWYHHGVAPTLIYDVGPHNNPCRDPGEVPVPNQYLRRVVCNECRDCNKLDEDTEGWVRVIFDTPRHFLSPDIELIAGLHIERQIAQHKEAAKARAMAAAQAEQDCLTDLAKAAEPALMDVIHTFAVSTHNDRHDMRGCALCMGLCICPREAAGRLLGVPPCATAGHDDDHGDAFRLLPAGHPRRFADAAWSHCRLQ